MTEFGCGGEQFVVHEGKVCYLQLPQYSIALLQIHHEEFDVKAALHELYGLSLKYYDDVSNDML